MSPAPASIPVSTKGVGDGLGAPNAQEALGRDSGVARDEFCRLGSAGGHGAPSAEPGPGDRKIRSLSTFRAQGPDGGLEGGLTRWSEIWSLFPG